MRFGLVGYGTGGRHFHAPFLLAADGVELAGVVARAPTTVGRVEADLPGGPVLLLDDLVGTGWTLTVAARALRAAGATDVPPLTLGTET